MIDDLTSEEEHGTIFESFSDIALCTLAVTLLLAILLAISISQNLNVKVNRNTFSGGMARPSLHLECTTLDFGATTTPEWATERALFAGTPFVTVHLFSPSLARIPTEVRGGATVALGKNQTFSPQQDMPLYQFMLLAPGIDPGHFKAEGRTTALLLPSVLNKQMVYEPNLPGGYRAKASPQLTQKMLAALWPVYANPIYPDRQSADYGHARAQVFVETRLVELGDGTEEHYIVIGHTAYRVPEAFNDGSLAWLDGFSSGLTEIVYLGETWSTPESRSNKRIDFFDQAGFTACADAYREYAFPTHENPQLKPLKESLAQLGFPEQRAGTRACEALAQKNASAALLKGRFADNQGGFLPPLLAHPEAWQAYIEKFQREKADPPAWFYSEFLNKIGFDRMVIERAAP